MTPRQQELLDRLVVVLLEDPDVLGAWLSGSLGRGVGDDFSDVDVWCVTGDGSTETVVERWTEWQETVGSAVWRHQLRWGAAVTIAHVLEDWQRFDVTFAPRAAVPDQDPASLRLLFDRDHVAADLGSAWQPPASSLRATLEAVVPEFLRVLGLLPVVLGRQEYVVGVSGAGLLRGMLIRMLLAEAGAEREGALHLRRLLAAERLRLLEGLPALEATRTSVLAYHLAAARVFLPQARRLWGPDGARWPEALEEATRRHLRQRLSVEVGG